MSKYIDSHEKLLLLHGKKVTCRIGKDVIEDAKIASYGDAVYICQNEKPVMYLKSEKLGYEYSWCISINTAKYENVNDAVLKEGMVTEIQLVDDEYEAEEQIQGGFTKEMIEEIEKNSKKYGLELAEDV